MNFTYKENVIEPAKNSGEKSIPQAQPNQNNENCRPGFIESVHEISWKVQHLLRPLPPAWALPKTCFIAFSWHCIRNILDNVKLSSTTYHLCISVGQSGVQIPLLYQDFQGHEVQ